MFQLEDDFEIDENLLSEVFDVENAQSKQACRSNIPERSVAQCIKDKLFAGPSSDGASRSTVHVSSPQQERNNFTKKSTSANQLNSFTKEFLRNVRPRKFPGPAGLLPERQGNTSLIASEDFLNELEDDSSNHSPSFKGEEVLSQGTASLLEGSAWEEAVRDLGGRGAAVLRSINVGAVRAKARTARAIKVPFLVLILHSLDTTTPDPCLYLRDSTGEMAGALHRDVWEKFCEELTPGSVLVLVNVGVVGAGSSSLRHYLNITANNIAAIYSPQKDENIKVMNMRPVGESDCAGFLEAWNREVEELEMSPVVRPREAWPGQERANPGRGSLRPGFPGVGPRGLNCAGPSRQQRPNWSARPVRPFASSPGPFASSPRPFASSPRPFASPRPPRPPGQDMFPSPKRPRPEPSTQTFSDLFPSQDANQSIVESLLEGIDTDSLFGDF